MTEYELSRPYLDASDDDETTRTYITDEYMLLHPPCPSPGPRGPDFDEEVTEMKRRYRNNLRERRALQDLSTSTKQSIDLLLTDSEDDKKWTAMAQILAKEMNLKGQIYTILQNIYIAKVWADDSDPDPIELSEWFLNGRADLKATFDRNRRIISEKGNKVSTSSVRRTYKVDVEADTILKKYNLDYTDRSALSLEKLASLMDIQLTPYEVLLQSDLYNTKLHLENPLALGLTMDERMELASSNIISLEKDLQHYILKESSIEVRHFKPPQARTRTPAITSRKDIARVNTLRSMKVEALDYKNLDPGDYAVKAKEYEDTQFLVWCRIFSLVKMDQKERETLIQKLIQKEHDYLQRFEKLRAFTLTVNEQGFQLKDKINVKIQSFQAPISNEVKFFIDELNKKYEKISDEVAGWCKNINDYPNDNLQRFEESLEKALSDLSKSWEEYEKIDNDETVGVNEVIRRMYDIYHHYETIPSTGAWIDTALKKGENYQIVIKEIRKFMSLTDDEINKKFAPYPEAKPKKITDVNLGWQVEEASGIHESGEQEKEKIEQAIYEQLHAVSQFPSPFAKDIQDQAQSAILDEKLDDTNSKIQETSKMIDSIKSDTKIYHEKVTEVENFKAETERIRQEITDKHRRSTEKITHQIVDKMVQIARLNMQKDETITVHKSGLKQLQEKKQTDDEFYVKKMIELDEGNVSKDKELVHLYRGLKANKNDISPQILKDQLENNIEGQYSEGITGNGRLDNQIDANTNLAKNQKIFEELNDAVEDQKKFREGIPTEEETLEQKLQILGQNAKFLNGELQAANLSTGEYKRQIEELRQKIHLIEKVLRKDVSVISEKNDEVEESIQEAVNERSKLQLEVIDLKLIITTYQEKMKSIEQELEETKKDNERARKELDILYKASAAEKLKSEKEITRLSNSFAKLDEQSRKDLRNEHASEIEKIHSEYILNQSLLQGEIDDLKAKITNYETQNKALNEENQTIRAEYAVIEKKSEEKLNSLRLQLTERDARLNALNLQISELEEASVKKDELLRTLAAEHKAEALASAVVIENSKKLLENLRKQLEVSVKEEALLGSHIMLLEYEEGKTQDELIKTKEDLSKAKEENSELEREIERKDAQMEENQKEVVKLLTQKQDLELKVHELNIEKNKNGSKMRETDIEIDILKGETNASIRSKTEISNKLQESEARRSKLQVQLTRTRGKLANMQSKILEGSRSKAKIVAMRKQLDIKETHIRTLEHQKESIENDAALKNEQIRDQVNAIWTYAQQLRKLEKEYNRAVVEHEGNIEASQAVMKEQERKIAYLEALIKEGESTLSDYTTNLQSIIIKDMEIAKYQEIQAQQTQIYKEHSENLEKEYEQNRIKMELDFQQKLTDALGSEQEKLRLEYSAWVSVKNDEYEKAKNQIMLDYNVEKSKLHEIIEERQKELLVQRQRHEEEKIEWNLTYQRDMNEAKRKYDELQVEYTNELRKEEDRIKVVNNLKDEIKVLSATINEYTVQNTNLLKEKKALEGELQALKSEKIVDGEHIDLLVAEKNNLLSEKDALKLQIENYALELNENNEQLRLQKQTQEQSIKNLTSIIEKMTENQKSIEEQKENLQARYNKLHEAKSSEQKQITKGKNEIEQLKKTLAELQLSSGDVKQLEKDVREKLKGLVTFPPGVSISIMATSLAHSIKLHTNNIADRENENKKLSEEIKRLEALNQTHLQQSEQQEILRRETENRLDAMSGLISYLQLTFPGTTGNDIRDQIQSLLTESHKAKAELRESITELHKCKTELREAEKKIANTKWANRGLLRSDTNTKKRRLGL